MKLHEYVAACVELSKAKFSADAGDEEGGSAIFGGTFRSKSLWGEYVFFLTTVIPEECGEYTQVNEDKWGYQKKENTTIEKNGKGYIISKVDFSSFLKDIFQPIEARVTAVVVFCICNCNSIGSTLR